MSYEKVVYGRLCGVSVQDSTVLLPVGGQSGGTGVLSPPNLMSGALMWDRACYILTGVAVAGGATGGSYTVQLVSSAISGYTELPVCNTVTLGPNSPVRTVLTNSHNSPCTLMPTHLRITQTATGGGLDLQLIAMGKQYRGSARNKRGMGSRVQVSRLYSTNAAYGGLGLSVDTTVAMTAGGASANFGGLDAMALWDNAIYYVIAGETIAGTHDVDVIGTLTDGVTYQIATTGTGGALNVAQEKLPLTNNFFGASPRPSHIIWTEVNAGGVSDSHVIVIAKSGRGSASGRG